MHPIDEAHRLMVRAAMYPRLDMARGAREVLSRPPSEQHRPDGIGALGRLLSLPGVVPEVFGDLMSGLRGTPVWCVAEQCWATPWMAAPAAGGTGPSEVCAALAEGAAETVFFGPWRRVARCGRMEFSGPETSVLGWRSRTRAGTVLGGFMLDEAAGGLRRLPPEEVAPGHGIEERMERVPDGAMRVVAAGLAGRMAG